MSFGEVPLTFFRFAFGHLFHSIVVPSDVMFARDALSVKHQRIGRKASKKNCASRNHQKQQTYQPVSWIDHGNHFGNAFYTFQTNQPIQMAGLFPWITDGSIWFYPFCCFSLFSHVISCYSYIQSLQWTNNIASANPSLARHPSIYRKGGLCWLPLLSNTCCHCCFKHEKSPTLAKKQVPSSASWFRNVRCTLFVSKPFCFGYSLKTIGYYFDWKQCLVI